MNDDNEKVKPAEDISAAEAHDEFIWSCRRSVASLPVTLSNCGLRLCEGITPKQIASISKQLNHIGRKVKKALAFFEGDIYDQVAKMNDGKRTGDIEGFFKKECGFNDTVIASMAKNACISRAWPNHSDRELVEPMGFYRLTAYGCFDDEERQRYLQRFKYGKITCLDEIRDEIAQRSAMKKISRLKETDPEQAALLESEFERNPRLYLCKGEDLAWELVVQETGKPTAIFVELARRAMSRDADNPLTIDHAIAFLELCRWREAEYLSDCAGEDGGAE